MNFSTKITFVLFLSCFLSSTSYAFIVPVLPGDGVVISQVDFTNATPRPESETGLLAVDLITLRSTLGADSGFINVNSQAGWIVQNLPVFPLLEYPYSHLSTFFNIGVGAGTNVTSASFDVRFSDTPLDSFPAESMTVFPIGNTDVQIGGVNAGNLSGGTASAPPPAPTAETLTLADVTPDVLFGTSNGSVQLDHPNIEAATNQCAPMAMANSLQFLENTTNLSVPHDHKAGIKGETLAPGETPSLVGQIGESMGRDVPNPNNRRDGSATGVYVKDQVKGKLTYLLNNNLTDQIETVYWNSYSDADISVDIGGKTATASFKGKNVDIANIVDCLKAGGDIEGSYQWPGGAHAVEIIGAGIHKGVPWMIEASDIDQGSDSKGAGAEGFIFSSLKDTDHDGKLNLRAGAEELFAIICERYIGDPPPTTTGLAVEPTNMLDPSGHAPFIDDPPATAQFQYNPGTNTFTLSGDLSTDQYFPLTGTIDANGNLSGQSTGTVAGYGNVQSTITGSYSNGIFTNVVLTIGSNGALPGGQPLTYNLNLTSTVTATTLSADRIVAEGETLTIKSGEKLVVPAGKTLTIKGILKIEGTLEIQPGGTVENSGIVNNSASILNSGTIDNSTVGQFSNSGTIDNSATANLTNNGNMTNNSKAQITNNGQLTNGTSGVTTNSGKINTTATGTFTNTGKVSNVFGGTVTNASPTTILNGGQLLNDADSKIENLLGGNFINQTDGTIDNHGTIINSGDFSNEGQIYNRCNAIYTGTLTGNTVLDSCDTDNDGVTDTVDNCPLIANSGQWDRDQDGIGNPCDICSDDPDNDIDHDGICGNVDNCPVDANASQWDKDKDGIGFACDTCRDDPDNDIDGDGICGNVDNCPVDANAGQWDTDKDGIGNSCDLDDDNDGLTDAEEAVLGTNPLKIDTDGDGVNDKDDFAPLDPSTTVAAEYTGNVLIDHNWSTITLPGPISNPVVIAGVPTYHGTSPGIVGLQNVTNISFKIRFKGWDYLNGKHWLKEDVPYLVKSSGRTIDNNGTVTEVGTFSLDGTGNFKYVGFTEPFAGTPHLFLMVQTETGAQAVTVRAKDVKKWGFKAALFEQQSLMDGHIAETVGYLAIYAPPGAKIGDDGIPRTLQQLRVNHEFSPVLSHAIKLEEEGSADDETNHIDETLNVLIVGDKLFAQDVSTTGADPCALRRLSPEYTQAIEWGSIDGVDHNWVKVPLAKSYTNPIVALGPISKRGFDPGVIRIRNLTSDSFEVKYKEWAYLDGLHGAKEQLFYLVAEEGKQSLGGLTVQAGKLTTNKLLNAVEWQWVSFPTPYATAPAVFTSVMSNNGWDPVTTRISRTFAGGFSMSMQEDEAKHDGHGNETLGWIAINKGSATTSDGRKLKVMSAQTNDQATQAFFGQNFARRFPVLLGEIGSSFGYDPSVLRYQNLQKNKVELLIQEEKSFDVETNHGQEDLFLFIAE